MMFSDEHDKNHIPELGDLDAQLAQAFSAGTPDFSGKDSSSGEPIKVCCQAHFTEWLAKAVEQGRRFTATERRIIARLLTKVREGLQEDSQGAAVESPVSPGAGGVDIAALELPASLAEALLGALETGDFDPSLILRAISGESDDPMGDILRALKGETPEETETLKPGAYWRRSGVRIVTEKGNVFLSTERALKVTGRILAWVSGEPELLARVREYALEETKRMQDRGLDGRTEDRSED